MGTRWLASPREAAIQVDALASELPEGYPRKAEIRSLIATLADECGCGTGGIFFTVATVVTVGYFLLTELPTPASGLLGFGFIFGASVLGKLFGLGLARLRLFRLHTSISAHLSVAEASYVDLH